MVKVNPAANIPLLHENNARQHCFSETEIRRIFEAASEDNSRVAGIDIRLLLLTGLRRDELRLAKYRINRSAMSRKLSGASFGGQALTMKRSVFNEIKNVCRVRGKY